MRHICSIKEFNESKDIGIISDFTSEEYKIIEKIKKKLIEDSGYKSWEEYVNSCEMGMCQDIASTILHLNISGIEKVFGEIKIVRPYIPDEEYLQIKGRRGQTMPHHWVLINDKIVEFSKGTLKDYVHFDYPYDVEPEDSMKYISSISIK